MKRFLILFAILIALAAAAATPVRAQEKLSGWCEQGGQTVSTDGRASTTKVQRSYPNCTVTVYVSGTVTLATIYSDYVATPKANPFTADANGYWSFIANDGRYDVRFSGSGITAPFTDAGRWIGGSGGGGSLPTCAQDQMLYYATAGSTGTCLTVGSGLSISSGTLSSTSSVGGSGTAGQVTFWTGAATISGDTIFQWNNTTKRLSLGAGATPGALLHMKASSGNTTLLMEGSAGTVTGTWVVDDASGYSYLGTTGLHPLLLTTNGLERIRVTSTGLVGINDGAPASQLEVTSTNSAVTALTVQGNASPGNADIFEIKENGGGAEFVKVDGEGRIYLTPGTVTGSSTGYLLVQSGDSNALPGGIEATGVVWDLGGTRTFTTTVPAYQREMVIYPPIYASTAVDTIDIASTVTIDGPPQEGANVTIDRPYSFDILSGNFKVGGSSTASQIHFYEPSASGTNYTAIKAGAQASNITYTWPTSLTASRYLTSDGSGNLSWATVTGVANIRQANNAKIDYGAVGDDVTDDTAALQACIDASEAAGGLPCYIPAGTYLHTGLTISDNGNVIGDGKTKTVLRSATNAAIIDVPTTANDASIRSLGIKGSKVAGSSQVGLKLDGSTYYYNFIVEDVKIEETGAAGLLIVEPFSSSFRDIFIDDTAGYALDYQAAVAPGNTFSQIYVGVVNSTANAGFRIRAGDFVCTECNGVNSSPAGGAWGVIGTKAGVDGDTEDSGANFTCIHCNLESFDTYGLLIYSFSKVNLQGNTTFAGNGAGTEKALHFDNVGDGAAGCTTLPQCGFYSQFIPRGYIDDTVDFADGVAAYANSQPIHVRTGFAHIQTMGQGPATGGGAQLTTYYDDTAGESLKLSRADGKSSVLAISATTTISQPGVKYIEVDSSGGAVTVNLPWSGWYNRAQEPIVIKDVGGAAAANNITIDGGGGGTVDGGTYTISTNGGSVMVMPDGNTGVGDWRVIGTNGSGGGGSASLTATYVGYGSGANVLTGEAAFNYDAATNLLDLDHIQIVQSTTTQVPFTLQAVAASTAELAQIKDSTGAVRGGWSTAGAFFFRGFSSAPTNSLANDGKLFYDITGGVTNQQLLLSKNTGTYNPVVTANQASYSSLDIPMWSTTSWELTDSMMRQSSGATGLFIEPSVATSGSPALLTLTGPASTTLAADTEAVDVYFNLSRAVQFTAGGGTFALQRAIRFRAPAYRATSAETIDEAVLLDLDSPRVSTNITITNSYAQRVVPSAAGHHGIKIDMVSSNTGNALEFVSSGSSLGKFVTATDRINYVLGGHTTGTSDTDGFVYISSVAGVPAGTPTAYSGTVPLTVDTSNSRLYGYFGGAWVNLTGAGGGGTPGGASGELQWNNGGSFDGVTNSVVDADGVVLLAPAARTSGTGYYFALQNDADTGITSSSEAVGIYWDLSSTRTWDTVGPASQREMRILAPAYASSVATTITNAATLGLGAPTAGANMTLTNSYALWIEDGHLRLGSGTSASELRFFEPSGSGSNYTAFKAQAQAGDVTYTLPAADGSNGHVLTTNGSGTLSWAAGGGGLTVGTTAIASGAAGRILYETSGNVLGEIAGSAVDANGAIVLDATDRTSGVASYFTIKTPADTTLTASTESVGIYFGGDGSGSTVTRQWSTGALTAQREYVFVAPTYAFAGASTLTTASTVSITGPPIAGTNATLTNRIGLNLDAASGVTVPSAAALAIGNNLASSGSVAVTGLIRLGPPTSNTIFTIDYARDASSNNILGIGRTQTGVGQTRVELLTGASASNAASLVLYSASYSAFSSTQQGAVFLRTLTSTSGSGKVGFLVQDESGGRFGVVGNGVIIGTGRGNTTSSNTANAELDVVSGSASRVGLRVDSAATPSVDIFQVAVNGAVTAGVSSAGYLYAARTGSATHQIQMFTVSDGGIGVAGNIWSGSGTSRGTIWTQSTSSGGIFAMQFDVTAGSAWGTAGTEVVGFTRATSTYGFRIGSIVTNTTATVRNLEFVGGYYTGTNKSTSGAWTSLDAPMGTGTGIPGSVRLRTGVLGSSGSTAHAIVERYIINGNRKTLTDAATNLFEVALPTLKGCMGTIRYEIFAADATDVQVRSGIVRYSAVNKGGAYTSEIVVVNEGVSASTGTLTGAWAIVTGSDKITIELTPAGSLTETTYYILYTIENNSEQTITIL